jgi:hypothetical protein
MKVIRTIGATAVLVFLGSAVPAFAQEHPEESKPAQHQDQAKPVEHEEQAKPAQQEERGKPAKHDAQPKATKQEEQPKPEQQEAAKPVEHINANTVQHTQRAKPQKPEQSDKPEGAATEKPIEPKVAQQARAAQGMSRAQPVNQQESKQQESKEVAQSQSNLNSSHQQQRNGSPQRTAEETQRQHAEPALRLSSRGQGRIPDDRFRSNFGREHVFVIESPQMEGGYSRFQYGGYSFGFVQPWPTAWFYTDNMYIDYIDGGYYLYNPYYPGSRVMISVVI